SAGYPFFKLGKNIDGATIGVEPARIPPAGAHDNVSTSFNDRGYPVRLHVNAIAQADLAFHHRDAVHSLTAMLVGQLEETEPLAGQIESAVDAPELVFGLAGGPSLKHRGGIDDADQAAVARLGRRTPQRLPHQPGKPISA